MYPTINLLESILSVAVNEDKGTKQSENEDSEEGKSTLLFTAF